MLLSGVHRRRSLLVRLDPPRDVVHPESLRIDGRPLTRSELRLVERATVRELCAAAAAWSLENEEIIVRGEENAAWAEAFELAGLVPWWAE